MACASAAQELETPEMPNPVWPTSLPPPLVSGATIGPAFDNVLETSMENGPSKSRRRFTRVPKKLTLSLSLSSDQIDTLDDFRENVLQEVLPFDWVDPVSGETNTYVIINPRPSSVPDDTEDDVWTTTINLREWM